MLWRWGETIGQDEAFKILNEVMGRMRTTWVRDNLPKLDITGTDARAGLALEQAIIMMNRPWAKPEDVKVVENTPERVVVQSTVWCPTLEACKMLNLSLKGYMPQPWCRCNV